MSSTGQSSVRISIAAALFASAVFLCHAESARATVISNYGFAGNPASTTIDASVADATFSSFTRTNLVDNSQPNVFRTEGFTTSATIDTTQFMGFTVTASGAVPLTFEGLGFDTNRSGQGPANGVIRYSVDGFATVAQSFSYAIPAASTPGHLWNFIDFILNPGQTAEFRFFGFNAGSSDATFTLDNVGFREALGPTVPEPTSLALVLTGVVLGFGGRRIAGRRKR
jgi:hypothetical protein